ncbi:MAG: TerC family protein [Candidatus Kapabacteria bacterium]|nr:TerC family protein [Candidatus Kapabacteria bacterium]
METLFTSDNLVSLLTLTILEIVLGIDNIIFISILVGRLDPAKQKQARTIGLSLALILRLVFLMGAVWIAQLTSPLFQVPQMLAMDAPWGVSGRDLIMLSGGLFLLAKATSEIHNKLEGAEHAPSGAARAAFATMVAQIIVLDIVFSIDSVITAIGLVQDFSIMAISVIIAVFVMQLSAGKISAFIHEHPTVKILALAFLMMVGLVLMLEGFGVHVPKGYVYTAMLFSISVEFLNMRLRKRQGTAPVELRAPSLED